MKMIPLPASNSDFDMNLSPGNDVESTTAMVGAGANVVVLNTGLGTPTGNPVAPVIKVSSKFHFSKNNAGYYLI